MCRTVMVTIAPEHSLSTEIIPRLIDHGVIVALDTAHQLTTKFRVAVDGGARHATHLFNAMSGVNHVEPGLATFVLTDGTLTFSAIADLVHVHPKVLRLMWQAAGDRMTLVSDQISTVTNKPSQQNVRLAGATTGLDTSVRNLVQTCGIPLRDVLVMASERPAEVLGLRDRGVIRRGYALTSYFSPTTSRYVPSSVRDSYGRLRQLISHRVHVAKIECRARRSCRLDHSRDRDGRTSQGQERTSRNRDVTRATRPRALQPHFAPRSSAANLVRS